MTQETLAEDLGVSQSAISNYLNGRVPSTNILFLMANHFGVSVTSLLNQDMGAEPEAGEVAKVPTETVRRNTAYDRLLERFETLSEEEANRWAKVFIKMLDELEKK